MPGPDNVVPDLLSRPQVDEQGQDRAAIRAVHLLSTAPPVRHTSCTAYNRTLAHQ